MRVPAAYELIAVNAGKTEPVHEKTLSKCYEQYAVPVEGQCDILISGIPYISPYNVNSKALNPLLVQVMAQGYFFHMYRHQPLIKKGGVMIVTHPCSDAVDPVQHPSVVEMYRRGNASHGAPPFYMWYWGQRGREHLGKVIVVGADNTTVPRI